MTRSVKKGPYIEEKLLKKVNKSKETGDMKPIKTWARRATIIPEFVGSTFLVHNGKLFRSVFVTENMVGHKLGEFSPTKIFRKHSSKAQK
jgi:small subunit ribosomal protein S19